MSETNVTQSVGIQGGAPHRLLPAEDPLAVLRLAAFSARGELTEDQRTQAIQQLVRDVKYDTKFRPPVRSAIAFGLLSEADMLGAIEFVDSERRLLGLRPCPPIAEPVTVSSRRFDAVRAEASPRYIWLPVSYQTEGNDLIPKHRKIQQLSLLVHEIAHASPDLLLSPGKEDFRGPQYNVDCGLYRQLSRKDCRWQVLEEFASSIVERRYIGQFGLKAVTASEAFSVEKQSKFAHQVQQSPRAQDLLRSVAVTINRLDPNETLVCRIERADRHRVEGSFVLDKVEMRKTDGGISHFVPSYSRQFEALNLLAAEIFPGKPPADAAKEFQDTVVRAQALSDVGAINRLITDSLGPETVEFLSRLEARDLANCTALGATKNTGQADLLLSLYAEAIRLDPKSRDQARATLREVATLIRSVSGC